MHEFFKPWRRKIGVVTLGLEYIGLCAWVDCQYAVFASDPFADPNQLRAQHLWYFISPLTMLSAYLMFSKPRAAKSPSPSLPPEADHA